MVPEKEVWDENAKKIINNGDMSASLQSEEMLVEKFDNIAMQAKWTGAPVGVFNIMATINEVDWQDITPSTLDTTGTNPFFVSFNQCPYRKLRFDYNRTSGTGTLNVWAAGKAI